ncbi:MAG TPA: alpha/beta hydrolase [Acidimicrobiia bacterium]
MPTVADIAEGVAAASSVLSDAAPVLIGHSAGAHLALVAASRPDARVGGLVLVAGVYDPDAPGLDETGAAAGRQFDPAGTTRLDRLSLPDCPVLVICGADDRVVPPSQSEAAAAALGSTSELVVCPGEGHFDALDPTSTIWRRAVEWVEHLG